jgi:hypothetical protein
MRPSNRWNDCQRSAAGNKERSRRHGWSLDYRVEKQVTPLTRWDGHLHRALWIGCALLSLVLAGCRGPQPAVPSQAPNGSRVGSPVPDELAEVLRQAALPESFAFGGRIWRAHQVHRVGESEPEQGPADGDGKPGETTPRGNETASGASERGGNAFVPMADFQVDGHQIYHREDVDEAVTDNLYLKAGTPAAAGEAGTGSTDADVPATGDQPVKGSAFVEYDAAGETLTGVELPEILKATGLPRTVQHGGKTWTARKLQRYDADLFDEFKRVPQPVQGYKAYQGDDKDALYLQAETAGGPPEGDLLQRGAGTKETLFVLYEAGSS